MDELGKESGLTPRAMTSLAVVKLMKAPDLMLSLHPEERIRRIIRVAQGLPIDLPEQVSVLLAAQGARSRSRRSSLVR